uniref:Flagellar assembly protein T C-terminal domain-containing protein n=1 Tax=Desulfobacca acetoxidans TaxID=60893 RepID=A0A7C3Z7E1_9BACT
MPQDLKKLLYLIFILALAIVLGSAGCSRVKEKWRQISGTRAPDADLEEEAKVPPETMQEEVQIEGKTWWSRNPYYLTMPGEPEYIYAEKGKELKTFKGMLVASLARSMGWEKGKESKGIPEEKVQQLVRQEVDRILREQGIRAFYQDKGAASKVLGRYVAVYPNPESARTMESVNRSLASALADYMSRQKDLKVAIPEKVKATLGKAKTTGALTQRQNLQALGDNLGVQALILTGVVPASGKNPNFLVLELYDTFKGVKIDGIAYPVEGRVDMAAIQKFVQANALRLSAALMDVDWFGRVEFTKEGQVYINLGQTTGLKVGDRLRVVTPGKEVVNPTTHAVLGFTGDESHGELRITELLGNTGAVAMPISGGPFKPNEKVKVVR